MNMEYAFYFVTLGLGVGLLLYALVRGVQKMLLRRRINAVDRDYPEARRYVDAVLAYRQNKLGKQA